MIRRVFAVALALPLFLLAYIPIAVAADEPSTVLDLSPLLQTIIGLAAAAIGAVGTWAISWLGTKLKLEADSQIRTYLDQALVNGITYARQKLGEKAAGVRVDAGHPLVAEAAEYVMQYVPDALAQFGITEQGVRDLVLARLARLQT